MATTKILKAFFFGISMALILLAGWAFCERLFREGRSCSEKVMIIFDIIAYSLLVIGMLHFLLS